ncbi:MAG: DegT/DnrJ/EryC1/StrS family aminotransferase, partial [bacterium]|nr:DegT/DnrJ/EryC1/StrS family aminotransferase [bacterium]
MPTGIKKEKPVYVTMPFLAPLEEYCRVLESAWASGILTHNGPLVQKFEKELEAYLHTRNLVAMTNGTIALQLAIRALGLKGEIITSPFTWIATASAIQWEYCTPVFTDIDPGTFNIDPARIEDAITHRTCAIMPVHVFSNPCDVETIDEIARRRGLKVISDAAHAMCVDYKGKSILEYGDISATSFHATKIYNSGEGGACVTPDDDLFQRLRRMRFFGHADNKDIVDEGCNGKMTEVHAALGLANLVHQDEVLKKRKTIFHRYYENLKDMDYIRFQEIEEGAYNYSYMPILFDTEERLFQTLEKL